MTLLLIALVAADPAVETSGAPPLSVQLSFDDEAKRSRTIEGRVVVEAQDGGVLLLGRDGRLWNVTPDRIARREATDRPFRGLSADEAAEALRAELGTDFEIVRTKHYIIATKAGPRYGQWCGALFERLYDAFHTHWRGKPLSLREPEVPLIAVVLPNERQFAEFAAADVGPRAAAGAKGYYSIQSNRIVLYDLTATNGGAPAKTLEDITRKVAANPFNAATVVHEATHQIAFNAGLHARQADNPLWLTEGMAMYFETPDLSSRTGWKTVGRVNEARLRQFRDYVQKRRGAGSLAALIATDERLTDPESAADAYAEAWTLTHFLIRTKRKAYEEHLATIAGKPPLRWDGGEKRLEEFQAAFGDLAQLDRELLRYAERLGR